MRRRNGRSQNSTTLSSRADTRMVRAALSRNARPQSVITRVTTQIGALSSSAGGVINNIVSLNPSSSSDWSTLAVLYDEWRLIGAEIKLFCNVCNSVTSQAQPAVMVYDNDDASTALTSVGNGLDYLYKIQFSTIWDNNRYPTLRVVTYSSADSSSGRAWTTTGSPALLPCSFKMYSSGNSASTNYLTYTLQLVLEFRGQT